MGKPTGFLEFERKSNVGTSPLERIKNYKEFHTPLPENERRQQASRCMDCGFENADATLTECPMCGSKNIDTIQRITGYLVGTTSRWNAGKLAELKDRVTHDTGIKGAN